MSPPINPRLDPLYQVQYTAWTETQILKIFLFVVRYSYSDYFSFRPQFVVSKTLGFAVEDDV